MQLAKDHDYRVIRTTTGWVVAAFFGNKSVGPICVFPDEDLPDWIVKKVSILNLVDRDGSVPGVGHRVGHAYWLLSGNEVSRKDIYES